MIHMQINTETAPILIKTPTFLAATICLPFIHSSIDEWLQSLSSVLLESWQEGKWKGGKKQKGTQWADDSQKKRDAGNVQLSFPFFPLQLI